MVTNENLIVIKTRKFLFVSYIAEHHKATMRLSQYSDHRRLSPVRGHSPTDPSYSLQSLKYHSHDIGYSTNDYPASIWHPSHMKYSQTIHPQMKLSSSTNENPLLKSNDLPRYSSSRTNERSIR